MVRPRAAALMLALILAALAVLASLALFGCTDRSPFPRPSARTEA